jgi:hypothetical protein
MSATTTRQKTQRYTTGWEHVLFTEKDNMTQWLIIPGLLISNKQRNNLDVNHGKTKNGFDCSRQVKYMTRLTGIGGMDILASRRPPSSPGPEQAIRSVICS